MHVRIETLQPGPVARIRHLRPFRSAGCSCDQFFARQAVIGVHAARVPTRACCDPASGPPARLRRDACVALPHRRRTAVHIAVDPIGGGRYTLHRLMGSCSEVKGLSEDAGGVTVRVATPGGNEQLRGSYLVGAVGASSQVRKAAGIDFAGFTYDERFLVASTDFPFEKAFDDLAYVNYIADSE